MPKYVDADTVHNSLPYDYLLERMQEFHLTLPDAHDDIYLQTPSESGRSNHFLARAAWMKDFACGVKVATVFPENTSPLPTGHSLFLLFSGKTGEPRAIVDGTALTLRKTAADSALAARFLARENSKILLIVGAGALAPHLIEAICTARPRIQEVIIWNRTGSKACALAQSLELPEKEVRATEDLQQAAAKADIISCATMTQSPLLRGEWIPEGCHIDLVGGFTPDMREADDELIRRSSLFVDARWTTLKDCGDLAQPLRSGVIQETDIRADHFELCQKKNSGRQSEQEITCFKNGGGGHLDLMTGLALLDRLQ